jgi:hypothetical protein
MEIARMSNSSGFVLCRVFQLQNKGLVLSLGSTFVEMPSFRLTRRNNKSYWCLNEVSAPYFSTVMVTVLTILTR